MDGTPLYPNGFHPGHHDRSRSGTDFAKGRLRLHAPPVFYYLIDFGLSKKYEGDGPYEAWGIDGQDRDAPELQDRDSGPYDPFLLDIFTLGNVYKTSFLDVRPNVSSQFVLLTVVFAGISEPRNFAAVGNEDDATKAGRSPLNIRGDCSVRTYLRCSSSSVTQEEVTVIRRRTPRALFPGCFCVVSRHGTHVLLFRYLLVSPSDLPATLEKLIYNTLSLLLIPLLTLRFLPLVFCFLSAT